MPHSPADGRCRTCSAPTTLVLGPEDSREQGVHYACTNGHRWTSNQPDALAWRARGLRWTG